MSSGTHFKLNTGASIPAIGFGTWQDKDDQEKAVAEALKAGYRHIDTARGTTGAQPHSIRILTFSSLRYGEGGWSSHQE